MTRSGRCDERATENAAGLVARDEGKKRSDFRALAEYYAFRAKRPGSPQRRKHYTKTAEHYRELAKLEEEVARMRPKPPAPSI
jgi:hypothetical protein